MNRVLLVLQFFYYFGLCLALMFALVSFMFGPMVARFAGWAVILALGSAMLGLTLNVYRRIKER